MNWLQSLFCKEYKEKYNHLAVSYNLLVDKYNKLNKPSDVLINLISENESLRQKIIEANNSIVSTAREFGSIQEFRQFSRENKIDELEFIKQTNDCDDFARKTQKAALNWRGGRIINCEYQQMGNTAHMLNTVVIGNKLYKFEPQTDRLWFFVNLD